MEESDIKRLGLILAIQAEIEGMKAENLLCGDTPMYQNNRFLEKAEQLKSIVYCHKDEL
jgi:hypothetical protein